MPTKLLTREIERKLPAIYATDGKPDEERRVIAKWFSPFNGQRFYAVEGERREDGDFECYGLVTTEQGASEMTYWTVEQLAATAMGGRLPLFERDKWWDDRTPLAAVKSGRTY